MMDIKSSLMRISAVILAFAVGVTEPAGAQTIALAEPTNIFPGDWRSDLREIRSQLDLSEPQREAWGAIAVEYEREFDASLLPLADDLDRVAKRLGTLLDRRSDFVDDVEELVSLHARLLREHEALRARFVGTGRELLTDEQSLRLDVAVASVRWGHSIRVLESVGLREALVDPIEVVNDHALATGCREEPSWRRVSEAIEGFLLSQGPSLDLASRSAFDAFYARQEIEVLQRRVADGEAGAGADARLDRERSKANSRVASAYRSAAAVMSVFEAEVLSTLGGACGEQSRVAVMDEILSSRFPDVFRSGIRPELILDRLGGDESVTDEQRSFLESIKEPFERAIREIDDRHVERIKVVNERSREGKAIQMAWIEDLNNGGQSFQAERQEEVVKLVKRFATVLSPEQVEAMRLQPFLDM